MGFVYVIEAKEAFKVGIAGNVSRRLSGLQTASPEKLLLRSHWESRDARAAEVAIHKAMQDHRLRGEWFDKAALPICEEQIHAMRDAGVLFEPGPLVRFPARLADIRPSSRSTIARPKKVTFDGSISDAIDLLWPSGHFPRWDDYLVGSGSPHRLSPVKFTRGGTYHYPLLHAAITFLRTEAEVDPASIKEAIISRGRAPHPEPDALTAVQHLVHAPAVCSNPTVCPGRYLPPRSGRRKA